MKELVEGTCWLCGRFGDKNGFAISSLCAKCNNKAGSKYAPVYIEFIKRVAERIGDVRVRHNLQIQKVRKPRLLLKQVIHQFVTTNGATFCEVNPWVRPFLKSEDDGSLPDDVFIYLFGSNTQSMKTTGITSHVHVGSSRVRVVSEFTFWPLGTVMSFGELDDPALAPIHQWSRIRASSNQTVDISLCINPTASALPVDFRTREEINSTMNVEATSSPDDDSLREMSKQVLRRGGKAGFDSFIYTAHPSQVDLIRRRKILK
jgi:hypothetical protein